VLSVALLLLTQVPPSGVLTLELDEHRVLTLPRLQRVAVSTGTADCKTIGNDRVEFIASQLGTWPFLGWASDGHRITFLVKVIPKRPPKVQRTTTKPSGTAQVATINDDLVEIVSANETADGGIHLTARNAKGELVEIDLQPRPTP